jgi:branched-chain amino acid transport system ATP-binding protein
VSDPSTAGVLVVSDVHHAYGDVPVLRGIDLRVDHGERVFVIGANGAGKSTVALAISGMIRPTSGSIQFDGEELVGRAPYEITRLGVSYTPAGRSTFSYMTVIENLELGYEPVRGRRGGRRRQMATRVDEVIDLFPRLRTDTHKRAGQLSGGVQRMVEVARAMMSRPRLLILDEPTLGLSGAAVSDLIEAILMVCQLGTTLIVIEQNVPVATEVCERGYLLSGGRIAIGGPSEAVLQDEEVIQTYLGVI